MVKIEFVDDEGKIIKEDEMPYHVANDLYGLNLIDPRIKELLKKDKNK